MGEALSKLLSAGGVPPSQGSVLDRVISQPSSEDHTVLYKLADYKKGGLLVETYTKGGMMAAEKLIREDLAAYMYGGGRGRVINRAEYLRWKFRDQEQVVLPIEASLSPHDPLAKWEDHTACWQMCYRGALGESLLHVLIICDTKVIQPFKRYTVIDKQNNDLFALKFTVHSSKVQFALSERLSLDIRYLA